MNKELVLLIRKIISLETAGGNVDWEEISKLSDYAISLINESGFVVDNKVYHFLEDFDARKKSPKYAADQIRSVEQMIE